MEIGCAQVITSYGDIEFHSLPYVVVMGLAESILKKVRKRGLTARCVTGSVKGPG
jgi:hypothetical protein